MDNHEIDSEDSGPPDLLPLNAIEARILGCLVEKQATTPDAYPLTQNAVVTACNQKSNRDPHLDLEPGAVGHALREMEGKALVTGSLSARTSRYEHRMDAAYGITPRQRAVLCIMLLRGPQTLAELGTRTERLADFPDAQDLRDTLDRMIHRSPALVICLGRQPGQREDRYMHLLCGPVSAEAYAPESVDVSASRTGSRAALEERVATLEADVADLREQLARLDNRDGDQRE